MLYSVSSAVVSFLLLQLIYADQPLMFANTICSSEEFVTDAFLPALRLAIDDVNNKILTKAQQLTLCNSYDFESNHTLNGMSTLEAIFESLNHNPDCFEVSVVIHPGCAEDYVNISATLAEQYPNLTQITYAFSSVASITLTHASESHVRMIPHDIHLASGLSRFVTFFNWTRVVIITQELPTFVEISQSLQQIAARVAHPKISFIEKLLSNINVEDIIEFPSNYRIIILNMYPAYAKAVLCEAYKKKMLYPDYVWITYGWYFDNHWWKTNNSSKCTVEEIGTMLNGAIALSHYQASYSDNLVFNYSDLTDYYSKLVYDAVMVYGISLNESESSRLTLIDVLKSLSTTGVSGYISFSNGFRYIQDVQLFQYRIESSQRLEKKSIGLVPILAPAGNLTFFTNESIGTLWPDGVPHDGTPREVTNYSLLPLTAVCYIYATVGIFFALVCLIFNIVFRNKKLVRLTSPNLNYLVIIGAIIIYSSVYTYFYIPYTPLKLVVIECSFRLWLTSFGFSLCYIPINVKMWRVYHICRKPRPSIKNLFMRDWHLMIITFIFVMVDVTILVSISAIDNARFMVAIIPDKEHPGQFIDEEGYSVVYTVRKCHSDTEPYWITPLFAYKFVLQFIGVFLAFSIRKVKIKGLNDSREVSAILYITTIILVATVLCTFVFGEYINVDGATFGTGIATATSFVLGLLFIPKMYGLYKDPKGETIFAIPGLRKGNNTGSSSTGKSQGTQIVITSPNVVPS